MTKTLLCGAAALAIMFAAPCAFAQDADAQATVEMDTDVVEATEHAMDDVADAAEDAADEAMDAADEAMDEAADEMEDAADAADDAVDIKVHTSVEVACPEGTEAQGDGTCMVTGDWSPDE